MASFAVVISCLLNPDDTSKTSIILDTVEDTSINLSSEITTHPIANGDTVADHMYNKPDSLSITGSFSLNGSKAIVVNRDSMSFQDTQDLFEKIKSQGIMCDIVKVQIDDSKDGTQKPRFKLRNNMVLTAIAWVERINTLGFTFRFNQALVADVQTITVNPADDFLPDITEPTTLSFTDTFLDLNKIESLVIEQLKKYNLIDAEFITYLVSGGISIAVATAMGVSIVTAVGITAAASGPVGWLVLGFFAVAGAFAYAIAKAVKKHNYKIEKFRLYDNKDKNEQEKKRFDDFIKKIQEQVKKLDNQILLYNISKDEPQECLLSVDGTYYDFIFERSGSANPYSLKVLTLDDKLIGQLTNIQSCPQDIEQCESYRPLFQTKNTDVYLVCPDKYTRTEYKDEKDIKGEIKNIKTSKDQLTSYFILCSKISLKDYNKTITNIIEEAILK